MPDITATRPVSGAPIETGWGTQVHDLLEGIQAGAATVPTGATPSIAVTFPRAYTAPPIVVVGFQDPSSALIQLYAVSVTTTGFVMTARRTDAASIGSATATTWIAIGTPA